MAETKSPKRKVPSFRMYLRMSVARTSLLSWNPTASKASRNLSAFKIPVFSLVWFLNEVCQNFKLHIRSLKSLNFSLPVPDSCNTNKLKTVEIKFLGLRQMWVWLVCKLRSKRSFWCSRWANKHLEALGVQTRWRFDARRPVAERPPRTDWSFSRRAAVELWRSPTSPTEAQCPAVWASGACSSKPSAWTRTLVRARIWSV